MTIIVAYAPTETASDSAKEDFYIQLSNAVQSVPPHDILVVLGDLNASLELTRLTTRQLDLSLLASPMTTLIVSSPTAD